MFFYLVALIAGILLGSSGHIALLSILKRRRRQSRLRAVGDVNVLGGLVLPIPEDVRWSGTRELIRFGDGRPSPIQIGDGNRLYIKGRQMPHSPQADGYCEAVQTAVRTRKLEGLSKWIDDVVVNSEREKKT